MKRELVIIGGGPAGMAAAVAAYDAGIRDILILERDDALGGILRQCIHNGFGLHRFGEELTGPEYAYRYEQLVREREIPFMLNTMVIEVSRDRTVTAMNAELGIFTVEADAIILAMGCRERPKGALNISGHRPAGIYTAGTAQKFVNMKGYMPGREVVILGSGDIGLIMARRMTLEGASVKAVCELMPYSGGLARNIEQCLNDFGIPLKLSHTVTEIHGTDRLSGVTVCAVDENRRPIPGTAEYILGVIAGFVVGACTWAAVTGLINNAVNFVYYTWFANDEAVLNDVDINGEKYSPYVFGYATRWKRLDHTKSVLKDNGFNTSWYDKNALMYYSEYNVHMLGWYANQALETVGIGLLSNYAGNLRQANITPGKLHGVNEDITVFFTYVAMVLGW